MAIFKSKLDIAIGKVNKFVSDLEAGIVENEQAQDVLTDQINQARTDRTALANQADQAEILLQKLKG